MAKSASNVTYPLRQPPPPPPQRPGFGSEKKRWSCSACTYENHALASHCAACGKKVPSSSHSASADTARLSSSPAVVAPRWTCRICTYNNHGLSTQCATCGTPVATLPPPAEVGVTSKKSSAVARAAADIERRVQNSAKNNVSVPAKNVGKHAKKVGVPTSRTSTRVFKGSAVRKQRGGVPGTTAAAATGGRVQDSPKHNSASQHQSTDGSHARNEPDTEVEECGVCGTAHKSTDSFRATTDCPSHCHHCAAQWVASQISNGNAQSLICPCGQHNLQYKHVRSLQRHFPPKESVSIMKIYEKAMYDKVNNNNGTGDGNVDAECPECNEITRISRDALVFACRNVSCPARTRSEPAMICVKHTTRFTHPILEDGTVNLRSPRRCNRCFDEKNGGDGGLVKDVLQEIQDAFVDRCPSCQGVLGEPADFTSCMCLRCSHCPECVCGFCYVYHAGWTETHQHVRICESNPRRNLYVESEDVWRELMRKRRRRLQDDILAKYGDRLTSSQLVMIRREALTLL